MYLLTILSIGLRIYYILMLFDRFLDGFPNGFSHRYLDKLDESTNIFCFGSLLNL